MSKKFICIIIVIGCISALLGISFANFNQIKENVETIVENNAIELWKYKTEIEVLGAVLKSYFIEGKYTRVTVAPNNNGFVEISVDDWKYEEKIYSDIVPEELTDEPLSIALDIRNKYMFFYSITKNQYNNEIFFGDNFFSTFFNATQIPLVITAILATFIIILISLIIDSISITFNLFDLMFSLFNI